MLTIAAGTLPAAVVWLTKYVVDTLAAGAPADALVRPTAGLVLVGLLVAVEPHVSGYLRGELTRRISRRLELDLYSAVNGFSGLSRFESPRFLDQLRMATRTTGGSIAPATIGLFDIVRSLVTAVSLLLTLAAISPVMAGILLLAAVPAVVAEFRLTRSATGTMFSLTPENRRQLFYNSLMTDLSAASELRLFGLGRFLGRRLAGTIDRIHAGERRIDRRTATVQGGLALLGATISAAGLAWIVGSAATGRLSLGDLAAFIAAVAGTQSALAGLVTGFAAAHRALVMFGYHRSVLGLPDDLPEPSTPVPLPALRQGIELRDVWFRYDDDLPWVLEGVTLTITAGEALALVGLNGAGKSTLIKLLCRFYDPTMGSIHWDGVDLRDVRVTDVRRRLGVLFQDYMSYDLTAAENIGLGDLDRLDDRPGIEAAARSAGVDATVRSLGRGYETMLSRLFLAEETDGRTDGGTSLSGGQWQRLAIARTLMRRDRDLLILDEPSAGLDAESEHQLHQSLRAFRAGRTSLLVSHRLGTLRDADRIVVLSGGRITETGTHDELMSAEQSYARLFTLQASGYGDARVADPPAGSTTG
ncbi:ATP-binding cassette subfamily B protein [Kribbella amoyensis]|uniref:ATP-binding cassette subfamily B protein n=2 Tax=Kribbella amoyensis TaxID=996641 RepID=A0A561BUS1_9ACTN|nr:ATP-binding cassette subfamily B protein [Kribbella amoyensis]